MLLCRISCELAGCVHQPIVGSGQTILSHLYFSRLSLAMTAKLNFFKTPISIRLVQVGPCPLPLEYQAANSHTGRQPCRAKSLYMKRFCEKPIISSFVRAPHSLIRMTRVRIPPAGQCLLHRCTEPVFQRQQESVVVSKQLTRPLYHLL